MNKKTTIIISIVVLLLIAGGIYWYLSQRKITEEPVIYVTFYSHNEEGDYWKGLLTDEELYKEYRADLIAKIKLLHQYGAVVNWETDHVVLRAMQKYEQGDLLEATGGKNILRWMVENMGMVVDPHGHLTEYNYADLAYLIEQMRVTPSSVVGGFRIYDCGKTVGTFDQVEIFNQLEIDPDGLIRGRQFPEYTWRPVILGQPAMVGHAFDEFSSGVWKPDVKGDFLEHDPNGKFIVVGQGYPHYRNIVGSKSAGGATRWYDDSGYILELASLISSGKIPSDKIYTASISFRDSKKETSIESIQQTLETLKELVDKEQIIYMDYEGVVDIWKDKFNQQPNRLGIENFSVYNDIIKEVTEMCWGKTTYGKCGDEICDVKEKQTGKCPEDCR